jgi:hypothetical protein
MECPQVADRGEGLQIWRVAANILNKQSRTAYSLEVRRGLTNPIEKHYTCCNPSTGKWI